MNHTSLLDVWSLANTTASVLLPYVLNQTKIRDQWLNALHFTTISIVIGPPITSRVEVHIDVPVHAVEDHARRGARRPATSAVLTPLTESVGPTLKVSVYPAFCVPEVTGTDQREAPLDVVRRERTAPTIRSSAAVAPVVRAQSSRRTLVRRDQSTPTSSLRRCQSGTDHCPLVNTRIPLEAIRELECSVCRAHRPTRQWCNPCRRCLSRPLRADSNGPPPRCRRCRGTAR